VRSDVKHTDGVHGPTTQGCFDVDVRLDAGCRDGQATNHEGEESKNPRPGGHLQAHDDGDGDHERDQVGCDISRHEGVSTGDGGLAVLGVVVWRAEDGHQVGSAFEKHKDDEGDGPQDEDDDPADEEAAQLDLGEEVVVEEGDGQLDEAEGDDADGVVG